MRLLLTLLAGKDAAYDRAYYHKLQGFLYSLLRGTEHEQLHDKPGYKFFCFSNPFPFGDAKRGERKRLLLSSPNPALIQTLEKKFIDMKERDQEANIGEHQFSIDSIKTLSPTLSPPLSIAAATPIIIRIPEKHYGTYSIPAPMRKRRYVYWRPGIDFTAFLRQLEANLFKKYNEFYAMKVQEFPLFSEFVFKKSVANHIIEDGKEQETIGSIWEFRFSHLTPDQKKILEFGLDCGFGERNALGFGFVNVLRSSAHSKEHA